MRIGLYYWCIAISLNTVFLAGKPIPSGDNAPSSEDSRSRASPATTDLFPSPGRGLRAALYRPRYSKTQNRPACGQGRTEGHGSIWTSTG